MAKKRKKKSSPPQLMSPKRYVKEKGRTLPMGPCFSSLATYDEIMDGGLAQLVVTRAKPSGKYLVGIYLVDVWCLGVKTTFFRPNFDQNELNELLAHIANPEDHGTYEVKYEWAHHLIYGSINYAESLGISPDRDFGLSRYILEPEAAVEEVYNFQFGKDGKPFLVVGPYDDGPRLISTLTRTVGAGNFDYIAPIGPPTLDEDFF
ncbi:MAG: hypothetical protein AAF804_06860 [Bacteroidota bacterium]